MMTKEERKNVNEELVALLLSFSEKQTAEILKAVTQDHFWDLPDQNKSNFCGGVYMNKKTTLPPEGVEGIEP